ncbi:hypothetical protein [Paenibacillus monticola]|uniref:Uncharacterized protein n=1 Tax=Paenibacillus monticola TaxID=2666075 RepID=A0A7X2H379_9BACL|nr:hypothetical protein [Paenibacillus monticola]MRN52603.1 hypothetical protein [Paenibacillus monticola]
MRKRNYVLPYIGLAIMITGQIIQIKSEFVKMGMLHFGRTMTIVGICIMIVGLVIREIQKYRLKHGNDMEE